MMRLQINISDDMVKQIDFYANQMGVSRSALCATFIGQCVMSYNKSLSVLEDVAEHLAKDASTGLHETK